MSSACGEGFRKVIKICFSSTSDIIMAKLQLKSFQISDIQVRFRLSLFVLSMKYVSVSVVVFPLLSRSLQVHLSFGQCASTFGTGLGPQPGYLQPDQSESS